MQLSLVFVVTCFLTSFFQTGATTVTPIQKVLEMMQGMAAKGRQEKHDDEERFRAFKHFCDLTRADKGRTLEAASMRIQKLTAAIAKAEADAEQLGKEVSELDASMDSWKADAAQSAKVREDERAAFVATDLDYTESIGALQRAIQVLKSKSAAVAQTPVAFAALSRVVTSKAKPTHEVREILRSFLQEQAVTSSVGSLNAPEANAYEFQSRGVVDMLDKLLHRFQEERGVLVKEETNRRHAYELLLQQITDDAENAKKNRGEKAAMKAHRLEDAAQGSGDLAETNVSKAADESYLTNLHTDCHQKSKDFENRQNLRAAELDAITKAIQIISSPEVAAAGEKHLPSLIQLHSGKSRKSGATGSLAQLRSSSIEAHKPSPQARRSETIRRSLTLFSS